MSSPAKMKVSKKRKAELDKDTLQKMTQEELIQKVLQLEAHNSQLKNIIQKKNNENSLFADESNPKKGRKIDFEKAPKRHILLRFYYLGWDYQGYVVQEDTINTIEFYLFKALEKSCLIENREKSNYNRCGRTDKGVSAFSQVISIDVRSKLSEPNEQNIHEEYPYCSMLNRLLPDNIRCYSWSHIGSCVSARFDCSLRTYKYYFPRADLNIKAILESAKYLVGIHDFRNLCKMDVSNGVTSFQREITFVDVRQCFSSEETSMGYQMFEFIIQGKSFLWHQIRCILSILLLVGQGKESPDIIKHLLNVEENPSKPQYSLSSYLPLNLYEVQYKDISVHWNIDQDNLLKIIELLQSQWSRYSVKSAMIRDMIKSLHTLSTNSLVVNKQAEPLLEGVKPKVYVPILSRMKCESLENKIDHFVKKKKLVVVEDSTNA